MKLDIREDWVGTLSPIVERLVEERAASRLFGLDYRLWGIEAEAEAKIRLGWLKATESAEEVVQSLLPLRESWRAAGVRRVVLCGMGGSSLAPEVMAQYLDLPLVVLDATSPDQVAATFSDLETTGVIVSSKSGSTVETDSHRRLAIELFRKVGLDPLTRMTFVTDPESPLDTWARDAGFQVMNADPNVGGRYSALTAFGIAPAVLAGGNLKRLISGAQKLIDRLSQDSIENPALWLAALLGAVPQSGGEGHRDKLLVASDSLPTLPGWVEQLVAESTGKLGRGSLPIAVGASDSILRSELPDAVRVLLLEEQLTSSWMSGNPFDAAVSGELGEQFLLWEVATAILGLLFGINPFDQPDVESAKIAARSALLTPSEPGGNALTDRNCEIRSFNLDSGETLESALSSLSKSIDPTNGYLALLAFASRTEHPRLEALQDSFASALTRPVSFGWGPRYLHSTGQYHKGGPQQGSFLQLRIKSDFDISVPGQNYSFGKLLTAQADGDAAVLAQRGRPLLILEFEDANTAINLLNDFCERNKF